jgi:hypothetical protein
VLRQISDVYNRPGEPLKIWFTDEKLDLYIWLSNDDQILKFQFTYDKPHDEKSLLWKFQNKLSHTAIDDGSRPGKHPSSPISLGEIPIDKNRVFNLLKENEDVIPKRYFSFIQERIFNP